MLPFVTNLIYNFSFLIFHLIQMYDDSRIGAYEFKVEPFSDDFNGQISWRSLGELLLRCAQRHADSHGFGFGVHSPEHLSWVFSRLIIQMERRPRTLERFVIKTWACEIFRQFTTRLFVVEDAGGKPIGFARSVWALIDVQTRQPADLAHLPGGSFYDTLVPAPDFPISGPGRIRVAEVSHSAEHVVSYTDLDVNGHLNSIRAIDIALDMKPAEFHRSHEAARIEMAYAKESLPGETLSVVCDDTSDEVTNMEFRKSGGEAAVKAQIVWKPVTEGI